MDTDIKAEAATGGRASGGAHRVVALCGPYLSGKTSLLESILYATGAIGRRGSTRAGTSIGDGAAEARKRGMSTEINVASADYLGDHGPSSTCRARSSSSMTPSRPSRWPTPPSSSASRRPSAWSR